MTDAVRLDAGKGRELGLSEADFAILTGTGLPRRAGDVFTADVPDGPFGLFAVQPLDEDGQALILGRFELDADMLYFLDVKDGDVVLVSLGGGEEETQFEVVNTSLEAFVGFVGRLGAYTDAPRAENPADDKARLAEIAEELERLDPMAFEHPHRWWAMVVSQLRRQLARRERAYAPAASHSEAFDRILDRLDEKGWRHVTGQEFASATGEFGLLTLPDDVSDAFSSDGALLRDVDVRWRGGLTEDLQSAFAWEGLVLYVPEDEPEEEPGGFEEAMERLMASVHGPQEPDEGTVTCQVGARPSDLCRILEAFGRLSARGYVAEPALAPTTSMCWQRVAERADDLESPRALFWNAQSHAAFDCRGDLIGELYLGWAGDAEEIAAALAGTGLAVTPPEDEATTFVLAPGAF